MKKMIALILALVLCASCMSGCFKVQIVPTETEPTTEATTEATEPTMEATEPTTEATEPTTEATEPTTEPTTEATAPDTTAPSDAPDEEFVLSGDWLDLQFILDGVGYQLNDPYKKLEANGWYVNMADYGYENGYVLNPGDKTYGMIDLKNEAYEKDGYDKIQVQIGFRNNSDSVKDISECDFWDIRVQIDYAFKLVEPHPEMTIGNGLKFGDTAQQVLDACGPCEDVFVSEEYGYQVYTYRVDFNYYLKLTVYDEFGITGIQLQDYGH